ncbi:protein AroM [Thermasporomyces composti]|uniref:Protein AroM n=1 Tax=Thermasporomyces composti TaxID=696763 RepID=A0A3D9V2V1_THECX|nr:protein AroM [Thermasporomyces composti]
MTDHTTVDTPTGGRSRTLGLVTIGQAPRVDLVPELLRWLPGVEVVERGALDGLGAEQIAELAPSSSDRPVLTTRLADGSSVVLDHDKVVTRLQEAVRAVEGLGVDATLVVCTGEFPALDHTRPLLLAQRLLNAGVRGLCDHDGVLGVVCPLPDQREMTAVRWSRVARSVEVAVASPYRDDAVEAVAAAARGLAARGARWIVLDCMGYTEAMRVAARQVCEVPVLLARSVVGRLAGEVVA